MQELLGRIARLDASAGLGLRVIACFDELIVGGVGTRALLAAAAALTGSAAGYRSASRGQTLRVDARGDVLVGPPPEPRPELVVEAAQGLTVWLERQEEPLPNDAITLERLALAVRIRHGRGRPDAHRRDLAVLVDRDAAVEERRSASAALGLVAGRCYRIAAAPLFATWQQHPEGPQDVVQTEHGPMHVLVLPDRQTTVGASPCGTGVATQPDRLDHSFRTALIALKLCALPDHPIVCADEYAGAIDLLADTPQDSHQPDVARMQEVAEHGWGLKTVAALLSTHSVREAARVAGVHHSTLANRADVLTSLLGFDPLDGFGRARLALAYLGHQARRSRVLDLPAPSTREAQPS